MRVGIVTFHCAYNFGSALQAWALKRSIEALGHEVRTVDYRGADFKQYKLVSLTRPERFLSNIRNYSRNKVRRDAFENFISGELSLTDGRYTGRTQGRMTGLSVDFDCFVCGSDQIWNLDCTHGPVGPYFLDFAGDARRVAYAPSLSHVRFEESNYGPAQREQVAAWLSRFSAISVRERSTVPLFQPLVGRPIDVCLDPTLLLGATDYESLVRRPEGLEGSLFVYMLERNDCLVRYAGRLAKKMNRDICYVSKEPLDFGVSARNLYGIGPREFLGVIDGCAAVVTNSFHATVFSLLFGRPFETFVTERSGSRMRELLESVGAESHLVDGSKVILPTDVGAEFDLASLTSQRNHSRTFLAQALGEH